MTIASFLRKIYAWKFQPELPYHWMKTLFVTIIFFGICLILSTSRIPCKKVVVFIGGKLQDTRIHTHVISGLAGITNYVYSLTNDAWISFTLIVFVITISVYILRQKIRFIYGIVEMFVGLQLFVSSFMHLLLAISKDNETVPSHDNAVLSAFVTFAGGIYLIVRGLTNASDGIGVKKQTCKSESNITGVAYPITISTPIIE